jgi:hypothetical protein
VAARLAIPVETVRTRTRRALERLRADLDRRHGDRRAWVLVVSRLAHAGAARVPIGLGVLAMSAKTQALAGTLLLVLGRLY